MKYCRKCGENKTDKEFYKNSACSDGLQSYCIDCVKQNDKERRKNMTPQQTMKQNTITPQQKFLLENYLKNNKEKLQGQGKLLICRDAQKSLGFRITTRNLEHAALISGQDWVNEARTSKNWKSSTQKNKENSADRTIARACISLAKQLGTTTNQKNWAQLHKIAEYELDHESEDVDD